MLNTKSIWHGVRVIHSDAESRFQAVKGHRFLHSSVRMLLLSVGGSLRSCVAIAELVSKIACPLAYEWLCTMQSACIQGRAL